MILYNECKSSCCVGNNCAHLPDKCTLGSSVASSLSDLESSGEGHGQPLDNNNKKKATGHGHSQDIHEKKEGHGHSHNIVPSEDTFQVISEPDCLDTATYDCITKRKLHITLTLLNVVSH